MKKILQELKPENVRTNTGVTKIKRVNGKVHVFDDKGNEEVFDSVVSVSFVRVSFIMLTRAQVLACHADQSREILGEDITADEETLLKDFKFKKNIAYLHSDPALMPARRSVSFVQMYIVRVVNTKPIDVEQLERVNEGRQAR